MNLYSILESNERAACASGVQFVPSVVINDLIHEITFVKSLTTEMVRILKYSPSTATLPSASRVQIQSCECQFLNIGRECCRDDSRVHQV